MYSNEPEVDTYIAKMIPVLAISFFTDGLHSSLSGKIHFTSELVVLYISKFFVLIIL